MPYRKEEAGALPPLAQLPGEPEWKFQDRLDRYITKMFCKYYSEQKENSHDI